MIVLEIICALIAVALVATILNAYDDYKKNNVENISFRDAFALTELPIITFEQGDNFYNFLLDTGSTDSHINSKVIDAGKLKYEKSNYMKSVFGMEGNPVNAPMVDITFSLGKKEFNDAFLVNDLSAAFDSIKKENGVTIHGILGTSFFNKYKYVIDFSKYVAYYKK